MIVYSKYSRNSVFACFNFDIYLFFVFVFFFRLSPEVAIICLNKIYDSSLS